MTTQKSFKRLVRTRMEKTGESYTTARARLLAAHEPEPVGGEPDLATSDAAIRERTGRGWEEWSTCSTNGARRSSPTATSPAGSRQSYARLAGAEEAERMKAWWRERLDALKAGLEA